MIQFHFFCLVFIMEEEKAMFLSNILTGKVMRSYSYLYSTLII